MSSETKLAFWSTQNPPNNFDELQKLLGYEFKNINLLKQALTRQSALEEKKQLISIGSFQRLEFIGDKILNLAISQLLFEYYPDWPEGRLTQETAKFVNNQGPLSTIARHWKLGDFLIVGRGEEMQQIRQNTKALSDAVEAVLGAIFLDTNSDYNFIKNFIANHWASLGLKRENQKTIDQLLEDYIRAGDLEKVTSILKKGANPNAVYYCSNYYCRTGSYGVDEVYNDDYISSALELAVREYISWHTENLFKIIKLLLEKGANPNWPDEETLITVLHFSLSHDKWPDEKLVELLLDYKAKINIQDKNGNTPLHHAATSSNPAIYDLLLKHDANQSISNKNQQTPDSLRRNYLSIRNQH
jgi:ribonuclease-3